MTTDRHSSYKGRSSVLLIRSNPSFSDPRVQKEAKAISTVANVTILGWERKKSNDNHVGLDYAKVILLHFSAPYGSKLLAFYLPIWWIYVFGYVLFSRYDIIHACDFDTCFPAEIAAKISRKKIVYDIFDYYADMISAPNFIKYVITRIDRWLINNADLLILVSPYQRKQIAPANNSSTIIIYNAPEISAMTVDKLKTISSINNYYFYGGLLSEDRLIREIISFFISNKELFLEIAGRGPLENFVAQMADTYANISFIGFVDNETVIKKSASSNAIFAFYDTSITNNVYACPNKLFEAMILGKPLITNKGTALAKFVKEKHIGYIIDPSPDKIGEILKILARDNVAIENIKLIDSELSAKYSWQTMEKIMVNSYLKLLSD